jgi:hypothetical protein
MQVTWGSIGNWRKKYRNTSIPSADEPMATTVNFLGLISAASGLSMDTRRCPKQEAFAKRRRGRNHGRVVHRNGVLHKRIVFISDESNAY